MPRSTPRLEDPLRLRSALLTLLLLALLAAAVTASPASITITSVSGTTITLSAGSAAGVKNGMTGKVFRVETIGGQRERIVIALFRVSRTAETESTAELTEVGEGFAVEPRMEVEFDQPLVPPPAPRPSPPSTPTPAQPPPPRPSPPTLVIHSNVSGDVVWLDGRKLGPSPQRVEVTVGAHRVRIEKQGYEAAEVRVSVAEGEEQTVILELKEVHTDAAHLLSSANAAWSASDWEKAVGFYGAFLKMMPDHPLAKERLGEARQKLEAERRESEERQQAEEERIRRERETREALERERANLSVYRETARAYLEDAHYEKAAEWLRKIAAVDQEDTFLVRVGTFLQSELSAARREGNESALREMAWAVLAIREDSDLRKSLAPPGMIVITPGVADLGSPLDEPWRSFDEAQYQVALTKGFYLSDHEVTQAEWRAVMGTSPSYFTGDNLPVEQVSWFDCIDYCNACSRGEGLQEAYTRSGSLVVWNQGANGYRLPTEAEWEYACRAGTTSALCSGQLAIADLSPVDPNLTQVGWCSGDSSLTTHFIKGKAANAWGLYDMHGNVWEWCWDWHGSYPSRSVADPVGPGSGSHRVLRGGGWNSSAKDCRSAFRGTGRPDLRKNFVGFRLARRAQ